MNAVAEKKNEQTAVAQVHTAPVANPVMAMISQAIAAGQPFEVIKELKDMAKELAADQARREFDEALAAAKAKIPVIRKNQKVGYEHKDGSGETNYNHEDLGEIARTIDPILGAFGLSYRYRSAQGNGGVSVTCILSHRGGHYEETTLHAAPDASGKKNAIQQTGSAITYLQRYTLKLALGLAAAADDDGRKSEQVETITEEQALAIHDLIDVIVEEKGVERGPFVHGFLKFMKAGSVEAIPAAAHQKAINVLNANRGAK